MGFNVDTPREELKNGPKCIFGGHRVYKSNNCTIKTLRKYTSLYIGTRKLLLERFEYGIKPIVRKASQLLTNDTANLAKNWMALVAKFTGRSRGKNTHTHRTNGAALDFQ